MVKVTIRTDQKTLEIEPGTPLVRACSRISTSILFGCRDGACGSCLVRVLDHPENCTPPSDKESRLLKSIAAQEGERLACQLIPTDDITIEVVE